MLLCPAYSGIVYGGTDYHHDVKFRLGTTLNYLPKLRPAFLKAVQKTSTQNYSYQLKVARKYGPLSCSQMCPHYSSCNSHNLYSELKNSDNKYIKLKDDTKYLPLEEVRAMLQKEVESITHDKKIHVIKGQCGLGKTYSLRNMRDVTIAFERHDLKEQALPAFKDVTNLYVTKKMPKLPEPYDSLARSLYSVGASKKADDLVSTYGGDEGKEFVEDRKAPLKGTVLTTHAKIFHNESENDIVIFDEDPIGEMVKCVTIKTHDVNGFIDFLKKKNKKLIATYCQFIQGPMWHNLIRTVHPSTVEAEVLYDIIMQYNEKNQTNSTNLFDLMRATHYVEHLGANNESLITYAYKRELSTDKTIVILSATISKEFAELIYGDRLVWHEMPKAKYVGKVVEDFRHSFSKVQTAKYTEDMLNEIINSDRPSITNLRHKAKLNKNFDISKIPHIGACTGYNDFIGQDINVPATPRMNPIQIRLFACVMGAPNVFEEVDPCEVDLIVNGYKFKYKTYSNKYLRAVDINYTASQLEQAVGRGRVLTQDCTVYVYSHFPVEQCNRQKELYADQTIHW